MPPPVAASQVPRIDVSALLGPPSGLRADASSTREAGQALLAACSGVGFATVTHHGVATDRIRAATGAAARFFALPAEQRLEAAPRRWNPSSPNRYRGYFPSSADGKDGLDLGEPALEDEALLARPYHERNCFPEAFAPEDRAALFDYFDAQWSLGLALIGSLVEGLGGDPARVGRAFARPASLSTLRLNYYPESPEPVAVSRSDGAALCCEAHVDSGFLTLLHQDQRGGLQVKGADGRWQDVEPDEEAFVVNTGLALQRLSGGALRATRHRVLHAPRERISIPFFLEPVPDFAMAPASLGLEAAPAPDLSPTDYESFLRESLAKFPEYDR